MRFTLKMTLASIVVCVACVAALADTVTADYDHNANFSNIHTYKWGKVTASDPLYVDRIKEVVDKELQAKGWQLVPDGGDVTVFATGRIHNEKELETVYNGIGGGWGAGWGWRGWGMGMGGMGMGDATTMTIHQPEGKLVIDIFDGQSKKLLWRGTSIADLSNNSNKNTKHLDKDVDKMFKDFPPKSK